jgi:integrase
LRDYRQTLASFNAAFPGRNVDEITTADAQAFLRGRGVGKKRFNNLRGELSTVFAYFKCAPRKWVHENPIEPIPAFKVSRDLPEVMTAQSAADIMRYVESYQGGPRSGLKPGCLVPYFALCLFAGLRPSVKNGEIAKLNPADVDSSLGVIRIRREVSKVKAVRSVTIQPNLAAWLARYPLKDFPIIPSNVRRMINGIRRKFQIGHDVMRHTYISMFVAKFRSMGDAALQAGNSETMIRRHYYNIVSAADAEAFSSIRPQA